VALAAGLREVRAVDGRARVGRGKHRRQVAAARVAVEAGRGLAALLRGDGAGGVRRNGRSVLRARAGGDCATDDCCRCARPAPVNVTTRKNERRTGETETARRRFICSPPYG
jgi:hypothetical protein